MQTIRLSAKEILDKDFKSSMKGYNKDEVDQFLDTIIQDYEAFQERIEQLERENEKLKKAADAGVATEKTRVRTRQDKSPTTTSPTAPPTTGGTNYDILKRLSNLEKEVFGRKLYE